MINLIIGENKMENKIKIEDLIKKYNPVLNPSDVAEYLQINKKAVYQKLKNGEIEFWKEGHNYKIALESMLKYQNNKLKKE